LGAVWRLGVSYERMRAMATKGKQHRVLAKTIRQRGPKVTCGRCGKPASDHVRRTFDAGGIRYHAGTCVATKPGFVSRYDRKVKAWVRSEGRVPVVCHGFVPVSEGS